MKKEFVELAWEFSYHTLKSLKHDLDALEVLPFPLEKSIKAVKIKLKALDEELVNLRGQSYPKLPMGKEEAFKEIQSILYPEPYAHELNHTFLKGLVENRGAYLLKLYEVKHAMRLLEKKIPDQFLAFNYSNDISRYFSCIRFKKALYHTNKLFSVKNDKKRSIIEK